MIDAITHRERQTAPHATLAATEMMRMAAEHAALRSSSHHLQRLPRGDGHTVFLIPGFMGGDSSLFILRNFLRGLGYDAQTWGVGVNFGARVEVVERMIKNIQAITKRNGGQKISLIGQSLGGIYAHGVAQWEPALSRQAISLGSPIRLTVGSKQSNAGKLYDYMNPDQAHNQEALAELLGVGVEPATPVEGVNSTSIFSRGDGVVHWSSCIQETTASCENIEIPGSHSGMGRNPLVFQVIADRLAQAEDDWKPYEVPARLARTVSVYTE